MDARWCWLTCLTPVSATTGPAADCAEALAMQDSKKYNEWMNIVDYETEEGVKDHERYKKDLLQSGFTPAQFLDRKRKLRQGGGSNKIHLLDVRHPRLTAHLAVCCATSLTHPHVPMSCHPRAPSHNLS